MKFTHSIIFLLHKLLPSFFNLNTKTPYVRIITIHHVKRNNYNNIKNNLILLKKNYQIITPKFFFEIINGKKKLKKNSILLTLDDGYYSQLNIAKILHTLRIKAIFFIIPNFVKINKIDDAKNFVSKNINNFIDINNFDRDMRNMQYKDIIKLKKLGHTIGMHTLNHIKLSSIKDSNKLKKEILSDKFNFGKKIGIKNFDCFAYPYGDIDSINRKSIHFLTKNYKYIFSGLRGSNHSIFKKNIFFRDAINDRDTIDLILGFLKGFVDIRYYFFRKKILNYLK